MSFNIRRVSKYIRWARNLQASYKTNLKISKEYADCCRKQAIYSLLGRSDKERQWADAKYKWVSNYVIASIP